MSDKVKPIVIDCSEVETPEEKVVERTKAEWLSYFTNQVRCCKIAEPNPAKRWGSRAKARLHAKAKAQGIELVKLS